MELTPKQKQTIRICCQRGQANILRKQLKQIQFFDGYNAYYYIDPGDRKREWFSEMCTICMDNGHMHCFRIMLVCSNAFKVVQTCLSRKIKVCRDYLRRAILLLDSFELEEIVWTCLKKDIRGHLSVVMEERFKSEDARIGLFCRALQKSQFKMAQRLVDTYYPASLLPTKSLEWLHGKGFLQTNGYMELLERKARLQKYIDIKFILDIIGVPDTLMESLYLFRSRARNAPNGV